MSDDEKRFLKFLDDVASMPDREVVEWKGNMRLFELHMRTIKNHMQDLMLSGACIFQTTMRYVKVVLRRQRKQQYIWIDEYVKLTREIYNEILLDELYDLFEKFLFLVFFWIIEEISMNPDDKDIALRNVFLDNLQFMAHLKSVAKIINLDISEMRKKVHDYSGSKTTKPHGSAIESHDDEKHLASASLALLNLKALCNNI